MTNAASASDSRVEVYLGELESSLRGMSASEREDIVLEIRGHILDSAAGSTDSDAATDRVLRLLGTPEELAQRYNTERMLASASHSFSPWLLLRTTWRWAKLGIKGTVAFLVAVVGYSLALACTIAVLLKPIMPTRVGMWWGNGNFVIGDPGNTNGMHELLGQWFVVVVVFAFAAAVGTTQLLRWIIRRRAPIAAH